MIKDISVCINSYKIIKIILFMLYHTVKYTCNMFTIALYHKYALISQFNIILPIKNYLSQGN